MTARPYRSCTAIDFAARAKRAREGERVRLLAIAAVDWRLDGHIKISEYPLYKEKGEHSMSLPGWVLAIFLAMAAVVPAGVYFAATLFFPPNQSYTYVGEGTLHGAPGPVAGAGLPFLAIGYGVYWLVKRRRKTD